MLEVFTWQRKILWILLIIRRRIIISRKPSKERPRLGNAKARERASVSFIARRAIGRRNVLYS